MYRPVIAILLALVAPLCAAVTNLTPKSEGVALPKGTRFFSGKPTESPATPLAELLRSGKGLVTFIEPVSFKVEEVDKEKVSEDGSTYVIVERARRTFPFEAGRYSGTEKAVEQSDTRIFVSHEGMLVIQRGRDVRLMPVANIRTIKAWVSDGEPGGEAEEGEAADPGDG